MSVSQRHQTTGCGSRFNFQLSFAHPLVASRPLFGVGVGGYYLWFAQFSPPELLEIYYRENAHNYFLQIAGELGLVGLAMFLWLLCTALWLNRTGFVGGLFP